METGPHNETSLRHQESYLRASGLLRTILETKRPESVVGSVPTPSPEAAMEYYARLQALDASVARSKVRLQDIIFD